MSKLTIFKNIALTDADTNNQTSTVGEPSIANNGGQILYSGNWYVSRSLDDGSTWDHLSPYTYLQPPATRFCCDQTLIYDPSRDLTFWILQYGKDNQGENTLRIAVKKGPNLGNSNWYWWDFEPAQISSNWSGEWFDYNHAALSTNFLYVGTNMFTSSFTRCVIFRIPLDDLADPNSSLGFDYYETNINGSLRCTQGAKDVMYFASRESSNSIKVFKWSENSPTVTDKVISISRYRGGNGYHAPGPDGNNWLGRCDSRITGAWVSNGLMGFMWSVDRFGNRPYPYVKVVRIDENLNLVDEPDIWSNNYAYAYPDAYPNDRGHVGITLFRGGNTINPGHVIGIWDDLQNDWELKATKNGTNGPGDGKWGDYLTCRRHSPDGFSWIATGFTLQGGSERGDVEPLMIHFGRKRDEPAVDRWANV